MDPFWLIYKLAVIKIFIIGSPSSDRRCHDWFCLVTIAKINGDRYPTMFLYEIFTEISMDIISSSPKGGC